MGVFVSFGKNTMPNLPMVGEDLETSMSLHTTFSEFGHSESLSVGCCDDEETWLAWMNAEILQL